MVHEKTRSFGKQATSLRTRLRRLVLLGLSLVAATHANAITPTKLRVYLAGWGDFSCDSTFHSVLYVGGMYSIEVQVLPEGKKLKEIGYTGLSSWSSPDGLEITVSRSSSPDGPLQPSDALRQALGLEYYDDALQVEFDSVWLATGRDPPIGMNVPTYWYAFVMPPELADSYLMVGAEWDHPQYGHLIAEKPDWAKILVPCSEAAQHMAWSTHVYVAAKRGQYRLATALADSFLALGWHEVHGLKTAMFAAKDAGNYDDAIRFLDLNFQMNHTVAPTEGWTPEHRATRADSATYERNRARLMELRNQQQQR